MAIKQVLGKNLMAALLSSSLMATGCAASNATRVEDNLKKETYTYDYDETPRELALALYLFQHNGQQPTNTDYVSYYGWAPRDLNENGVLDYHREVNVTRNNGRIVEVYERFVTRAQASPTGNELVSEVHLRRNDNGTWAKTTRSEVVLDEANLERQLSNHTSGQYRQEVEDTGRALDGFWEQMRRQQNPTQRPMNNQL